jgi:hypothetical protein
MPRTQRLKLVAGLVGLASGAYAALAAIAWSRFGTVPRPRADEQDDLLDRFIPDYEIVERHHVRVNAPADVTLAAAREFDLFGQPLIRAIFRMREVAMGARPDAAPPRLGLVSEALAMGWGVLAEAPDREVVVGAVTRPWEPDVVFRAVPPEVFARFAEPGYVKIVWTLRADPVDRTTSVFRTETRAVATDPTARRRFRRYWSLVSPGIVLIRWLALNPMKTAAERRYRERRTRSE